MIITLRRTLMGLSAAASVAVSLVFGLAGCASTPPVRFHSLLPVDDAATRSAAAGSGFTVTLGPVSVPPQVDQPQWLVRAPDGSLSLLEQERWAAPLRSELRSALLDRWVTGWGAVEAPLTLAFASAASSASPASPSNWRVVVDVTRFESFPGREVRLDSRWSASAGQRDTATIGCRSVIRESVGEGMLALAAGHRSAVARLADEIAQQVKALQRGESGRCTTPADAPPG